MFFHFGFISHMGSDELEFEFLEEAAELLWLGGVKLGCSAISAGGHQMYYRLQHCGIQAGKCQLIGWRIQSGW